MIVNVCWDYYLFKGGCRNSSPAGKRRVPGTELSSLDSLEVESAAQYRNTHNIEGDSLNTSAVTIMTLGIFICMASITLFVSVFGVLQVFVSLFIHNKLLKNVNLLYLQLNIALNIII